MSGIPDTIFCEVNFSLEEIICMDPYSFESIASYEIRIMDRAKPWIFVFLMQMLNPWFIGLDNHRLV